MILPDPSSTQPSLPQRYARHWMYDTSARWPTATGPAAHNNTPWMRGLPPRILQLDLVPLSLQLPLISGPKNLGRPAWPRVFNTFNPSIVHAPRGLCPRCAYVVAIRVDSLHQCNASSPLLHRTEKGEGGTWYKGTALAVLDSSLALVGWTWFLARPENMVGIWDTRWTVKPGVADSYPPPWSGSIFDTRLLNLDGSHIFASSLCASCDFAIAKVELTGTVTPDGGITHLRAWSSRHDRALQKWTQGRNQAMFAAPSVLRDPHSPPALMVQPWLGLVASFGVPTFSIRNITCYEDLSSWYGRVSPEDMRKTRGQAAVRINGVWKCGTTPVGARLALATVLPKTPLRPPSPATYGVMRLVANHTTLERTRATFDAGGARFSPTASLVRVTRPDGCAALIGIGHTHRGTGFLENRNARRRGQQTHFSATINTDDAPPSANSGDSAGASARTGKGTGTGGGGGRRGGGRGGRHGGHGGRGSRATTRGRRGSGSRGGEALRHLGEAAAYLV